MSRGKGQKNPPNNASQACHSELELRNDSKKNPQQINLWLDDTRTPPDDTWIWVKTIEEAKQYLEAGVVACASLDNDLGTDSQGKHLPEGRKLVLWMAEHDCWPWRQLSVHSSNSVAVDYMVQMIERYGPLQRQGRSTVFVA